MTDEKTLLNNGSVVVSVMQGFLRFDGVKMIPANIRRIIESDAWREFMIPTSGEIVRYEEKEFPKFVKAKPMKGLGVDYSYLMSVCKDDPQTQTLIKQKFRLPLGEHGGDRSSIDSILDNKHNSGEALYKLRRLERDNPDLAEKVVQGEMSADAAAVEAGFQNLRRAVNMDNPESAAGTLIKFMTRENIADLARILYESVQDDDIDFGHGR